MAEITRKPEYIEPVLKYNLTLDKAEAEVLFNLLYCHISGKSPEKSLLHSIMMALGKHREDFHVERLSMLEFSVLALGKK